MFLEEQGYVLDENIFYQDNMSSIVMERDQVVKRRSIWLTGISGSKIV